MQRKKSAKIGSPQLKICITHEHTQKRSYTLKNSGAWSMLDEGTYVAK